MPEKDSFFAAPDLDTSGDTPAARVRRQEKSACHSSPARNIQQGSARAAEAGGCPAQVPAVLSDELRKSLTEKLLRNSSGVAVQNVNPESFGNRVIARFLAPHKSICCDIEIPLDITANDLVVGLNEAYKLGIDLSDMRQCYFSCENPVALLKGKRLLGEFGLRDGSLITYFR